MDHADDAAGIDPVGVADSDAQDIDISRRQVLALMRFREKGHRV